MAEYKTRSHQAEAVVVEKKVKKAEPKRTVKASSSKKTVKAILEEDTQHANPE